MKPIALGMMGAMSSLVALPGSVLAASPDVPRATSFAQLLEPVPEAAARLHSEGLRACGINVSGLRETRI